MSLRESYQQHKKLYVIGAAALIVLIAGWSYARSRANDPKFTTSEVRTGNITASVQGTFTSLGPDTTRVSCRESMSGPLLAWFYTSDDLQGTLDHWMRDLKVAAESDGSNSRG